MTISIGTPEHPTCAVPVLHPSLDGVQPCGLPAHWLADPAGPLLCFNHASMKAFTVLHVLRGDCAMYQAWVGGRARCN